MIHDIYIYKHLNRDQSLIYEKKQTLFSVYKLFSNKSLIAINKYI